MQICTISYAVHIYMYVALVKTKSMTFFVLNCEFYCSTYLLERENLCYLIDMINRTHVKSQIVLNAQRVRKKNDLSFIIYSVFEYEIITFFLFFLLLHCPDRWLPLHQRDVLFSELINKRHNETTRKIETHRDLFTRQHIYYALSSWTISNRLYS